MIKLDSKDVIDLYKRGYSIDYIINKFYRLEKQENKVINLNMRKIIMITNNVTKENMRTKIYNILYGYVKANVKNKKDRLI